MEPPVIYFANEGFNPFPPTLPPPLAASSIGTAFKSNLFGSEGFNYFVLLLLSECLRLLGLVNSPIFAKLLKIYSRVV